MSKKIVMLSLEDIINHEELYKNLREIGFKETSYLEDHNIIFGEIEESKIPNLKDMDGIWNIKEHI